MSENRFKKAQEEAKEELLQSEIEAEAAELKERNLELIKDVKPVTMKETVELVKNKKIKTSADENGNTFGTECNGWTVLPVMICGKRCFAMGPTESEAQKDKRYIAVRLAANEDILPECLGVTVSGRYLTKAIHIPNSPCCICKGRTIEELEEDEKECRIEAAKHPGARIISDTKCAEELVEAELDVLTEIVKDGIRFIYLDNETVCDLNGDIVVDLSDVENLKKLPESVKIELATSRIDTSPYLQNDTEDVEYDEDEDYEEYEDDDEYDEDEDPLDFLRKALK